MTRREAVCAYLKIVSRNPCLEGLRGEDLAVARQNDQMITVFMHAYPSEHKEAGELATLFRERGVSHVEIEHLTMAIDGNPVQPLNVAGACTWATEWDSAHTGDGPHVLSDYENAVGEWLDKRILGTQLGPNENGRHWPSRREKRAAQ